MTKYKQTGFFFLLATPSTTLAVPEGKEGGTAGHNWEWLTAEELQGRSPYWSPSIYEIGEGLGRGGVH